MRRSVKTNRRLITEDNMRPKKINDATLKTAQ